MNPYVPRQLLVAFFILFLPTANYAASFAWSDQVRAESLNGRVAFEKIALSRYTSSLYAAGSSGGNAMLIKYSLDETEVWRRSLDIFNGSSNYRDITTDNNGVYLAGGNPNPFIVKYTHAGDIDWVYSGDDQLVHEFTNIFLDPEGIYVSGIKYATDDQTILIRLDYDGNEIWRKTVYAGGWASGPMLVHDGLIYLQAGFKTVYVYDTGGSLVSSFQVTNEITGMAYYDNHIYTSGTLMDVNGVDEGGDVIAKIDLAGNAIWQKGFSPEGAKASGIAWRSDGIYVAGQTSDSAQSPEDVGLRLNRYDFDGALKNEWLIPGVNTKGSISLVTTFSYVYLGGSGRSTGFVGKFSEVDLLPAGQLESLNDVNGDGFQDLALLTHRPGQVYREPVNVEIESVGASSGLDMSITFDSVVRPVDLQILPDLNANNSSEIAVLDAGKARVEIRDSLSGEKISQLEFSGPLVAANYRLTAIRMALLADQNSNGYPELAVLQLHEGARWVVVEIRDTLTAELLGTTSFNPTYTPRDLVVMQDLDGDNKPELGVLSTDQETLRSKLEIRSLNGSFIKNIWLDKRYDSTTIVSLPSVNDAIPGEAAGLAILQSRMGGGGLQFQVVDPAFGKVLRTIGFNWHYQPVAVVALEDMNSNGAPELAILGKMVTQAGGVDSVSSKVEVRDSLTGGLIKNIWQAGAPVPLDMTVLPGLNGNAVPGIGTLFIEEISYSPLIDDFSAYIKNALTGQIIEKVEY